MPDGVIIYLPQQEEKDARLLKLQVVSDKIIHMVATPESAFSNVQSLIAIPPASYPVNWSVVQNGNNLKLITTLLVANVDLRTGIINFTDKAGKSILSERSGTEFTAVSYNGENDYHITQSFNSPADEAFYGLGQHQNGIINIKNQHVDLL